eukprot:SAG31_NODE_2620_length_5364_cov_27.556315_4_plen_115_part_00
MRGSEEVPGQELRLAYVHFEGHVLVPVRLTTTPDWFRFEVHIVLALQYDVRFACLDDVVGIEVDAIVDGYIHSMRRRVDAKHAQAINADTFSISAVYLSSKVPYFSNSCTKTRK